MRGNSSRCSVITTFHGQTYPEIIRLEKG